MASSQIPNSSPVFVCYAHKDNDSPDPSKRWLDRLLEHLEPLVLQNLVNAWSDQQIEAGDIWNANIQSQLQQAKAAVLLVSPAFLASKYIRNSELPVLLKQAKEHGLTIISIIIKPCLFAETKFKYPDPANGPEEFSLANLQAANSPTQALSGMSEHEQDRVLLSVAQRLLKLVQQNPLAALAAPTRRCATAAAGPIHNLPFRRNEYFTGREQVLKDLRAAMTRKRAAALTQAISGLGGIGKTQTALEYAYRYAKYYQAIFWVKADSHLALTSSFIEIAALLNLPEKDAQESDQAIHAVMSWLEHNEGWLLIFDNADFPELVKPFRPRSVTGHVLLTSRAQLFDQLGISTPIELQTMLADEAVEFLFTRTGKKADNAAEKAAAIKLADELGYLPLALEQAGAYILAKKARFQDFLAGYGKQRLKLLQESRPVAGEYPQSVVTTWAMNFKEVESASEAAADVLTLSAFLRPDHIPFELIVQGKEELGPIIAAALDEVDENPLLLNQVLVPLTLYSLVRLDSEQQTFSLHRLVQEVVQARLDESARRMWAERAVEALNEVFPLVEFENWPDCERLLSHARQAAWLIEQWEIVSQSAARLLNQTGVYCHYRGQYKEAEPLYKQALAIDEKSFGPDHLEIATDLNNLAELYRQQGKLADAEPLFKQALAIRQQALGPDHPYVAISLNNLAFLYNTQGKLTAAEPLFKQALAVFEEAFGPDHLYVANSLNNLAFLYKQQGRLDDAEPLFKQALAIRQQALGPNHPDVATGLNNLASLYLAQDKLADAEPLFQQAFAIDEKALGPDHPDLATDLNNLALLYYAQGKLTDAEPLYKQAIAILEKALGPQHPNFASCLINYAALLRALHRDDEAAELENRARAIQQAQ